ncbi:MAG: hypothetical protein REI78_05055 [Pedobacter sp.]|nr:hypothetical protein [Pedobacter sp.]
MKKIYFTLGLLVLATFAMAYLYFSKQNVERSANELSLNAVAQQSGFVLSFENDKSFYEILSGQELLQDVLGEEKSSQLIALKNTLVANAKLYHALADQKIYIGMVPAAGTDQIDYVLATQFEADPKNIVSALGKMLSNVQRKPGQYDLSPNDSTHFVLGLKGNLLIISNAAQHVDNALNKQQKDIAFANYIQQQGRFNKNTLANLYLDFDHLPSLLKQILNSNLTGELSILNKQQAFASLSYNFSKEKILLNGTTTIGQANTYEALYTDMPAQQQTIVQLLPEKTANYTSYTLLDYNSWKKKFTSWLAAKKEDQRIAEHLSNLNQKYRLNLQQIFSSYFKDQLITFELNTGEKFGAICLKNGEKVNQLLLDLSADYATDVKIFKEPYIPYAFFGEPFKKFERPFYTIIDNYLVMSNYASSIEVFLNSYNNNRLLTNTQSYINFSDQLPSAATICYYVDLKNSVDIFGKNLKMPYYRQYLSKNGFRSYSAFAYQLTADKGKFQSNVLLYKKMAGMLETDTLKTN